jgi:hypothetical protein
MWRALVIAVFLSGGAAQAADVPTLSSLIKQANAAQAKGDSPGEIAAMEQALALEKSSLDKALLTRLRIRLGSSYLSARRFFDAMGQYETALAAVAANPALIKDQERFVLYDDVSYTEFAVGDYQAAADNSLVAVGLHKNGAKANPVSAADLYDRLGRAQRILGFPTADANLAIAQTIYQEAKLPDAVKSVALERGRIAMTAGRFDAAQEFFAAGKAMPADMALLERARNPQMDMIARFAAVSAPTIIPATSGGEARNVPDCASNGYGTSDWVVVDFSVSEYGGLYGETLAASSRTDLNAEPFLQTVSQWVFPWNFTSISNKIRSHQRIYLSCARQQPSLSPSPETYKAFRKWAIEQIPATLDPAVKRMLNFNLACANGAAKTRSAMVLNDLFVSAGYPPKSRVYFLWQIMADGTMLDRKVRQPYYDTLAKILEPERQAAFQIYADTNWLLSSNRRARQFEASDWNDRKTDFANLLELTARAKALTPANADLVEWLELKTALMGVQGDKATAAAEKLLQDMAARDDSKDGSTVSRTAARLNLASYVYNNGRRDEADRLIDRTGLSADQCSLFDQTRRRLELKQPTYPVAAMDNHLSGWAMVDHDLSAEGKALNPRTISSYPPFVFSGLSEKSMGTTVFTPVYSKGGPVACKGSDMSFFWKLAY